MNTGQIISTSAHAALLGWALLGDVFSSEPLPFEITQVTAVSAEEYAALFDRAGPTPVPDVTAPETPDVPQEAPALSSAPDAAPARPAPEAATAPAPDAAPAAIPAPAQAEAQDEAPVLETPSEDIAALVPEVSLRPQERPQERPAERVAPEQVAPPEPDTAVDDVVREDVVQDAAGESQAEPQEATAPEAAATEIVTEAEQAAPSSSVRPQARPARIAAAEPAEPSVAAPETPAPEAPAPAAQPSRDNSVEAALAAALGGAATQAPATPAPSVASGPPLTRGEKDALRVSVQTCWNVGSLSSEALRTTVVVSVEMSEDSRPVQNTIRMDSFSGGSEAAARQAFEAARRAIIRCGARGFNLPVDKFASWQTIEMTFNPENMRIK